MKGSVWCSGQQGSVGTAGFNLDPWLGLELDSLPVLPGDRKLCPTSLPRSQMLKNPPVI